jgi:hypothetical protein
MKLKHLLVMAAIAMTLSAASAQPQTSVEVTRDADKATVVGTHTTAATIVAIEPDTRTVTLKDKKGRVFELEVGDEARNFDQLKVGDVVTAQYQEAISLSLTKTSGTRSAAQTTTEQRSAPGQKPGGTVGREITVMADILAVDPKTNTVILKGPQGNEVDVIVQDPEQMKNIRKGDQVQVVYTEALAISVTPGAVK